MTASFNPGRLLTAVVVLASAVLIGLGTWQAQKIGPKTKLINSIEQGLSADPMVLPVHMDDPEAMAFRRMTFEGEALDRSPVRLFGTNLAGQPGYYLYKPVVREFGRVVLVNFGWVPMDAKRLPQLPVGKVSLSGVLVPSATAGSFTPPNSPETDTWFTADVFELATHFGLGSKDFYHVRFFKDHVADTGSLPLGGQVRVNIPNDHLEYMLTWYGIAAALVGVYIVFGRKKALEQA